MVNGPLYQWNSPVLPSIAPLSAALHLPVLIRRHALMTTILAGERDGRGNETSIEDSYSRIIGLRLHS